jgi:UDP-N-acetylglucosamine diphosphorylase/glucosamine-1-phosphate N-acetyltransferase
MTPAAGLAGKCSERRARRSVDGARSALASPPRAARNPRKVTMRIALFEDFAAEELRPLALARPGFSLSIGGTTLLDAAARLASSRGFEAPSWFVRPRLEPVVDSRFAGAPCGAAPQPGERSLLLNALAIPRLSALRRVLGKAEGEESFRVEARMPDGARRVAAAYFPSLPFAVAGHVAASIPPLLLAEAGADALDLELPLLESPERIVGAHAAIMRENLLEMLELPPLPGEDPWREIGPNVYARGGATIHGTVAFDAAGDEGPILLDRDCVVGPFCYLRGPLLIGAGARVNEHSSIKGNTHIGAHCRVGGEVHSTTFEPFSNKGHHGFLGHAWVGSWVNLGAGTSNSNLKNTYGEVRVNIGGKSVGTGSQFFGCLIGDGAKTAINTSIFTGKIVGAYANVYGFVGTNVASFSNHARSFAGQATRQPLDAAIKTQARMYERRGMDQTPADREFLRSIHELTRDEWEPLPDASLKF